MPQKIMIIPTTLKKLYFIIFSISFLSMVLYITETNNTNLKARSRHVLSRNIHGANTKRNIRSLHGLDISAYSHKEKEKNGHLTPASFGSVKEDDDSIYSEDDTELADYSGDNEDVADHRGDYEDKENYSNGNRDGVDHVDEKGIKAVHLNSPSIGREIVPRNEHNIFILETSNATEPLHINYRVLGSIESWCRQNPNWTIWFLHRPPLIADEDGLVRGLQHECQNLRLVQLDPEFMIADTPLAKIYHNVTESPWPHSHMSDLLRLVLLWKYGGWYTDSDTICIRDISSLGNVLSLGDYNKINTAIMHFGKGHPFLLKNMKILAEKYKPRYYITAIGNVQRQTILACNVTRMTLYTLGASGLDAPSPCPGFRVLHHRYLFPIPWVAAGRPFVANSYNKESKKPRYYITAIGNAQRQTILACKVTHKTLYTLGDIDMDAPSPCPGFRVIHHRYLFPVPWGAAWRPFVVNSYNNESAKIDTDTFTIHLANSRIFKMGRAVLLGRNTFYEHLFQKYCPFILRSLSPRALAL